MIGSLLGFQSPSPLLICSLPGSASNRFSLPKSSANATPVVASVDSLIPATGAITFGGLIGYCVGRFARQFGQTAASVIGVVFLLFQAASWPGYVQVHWDKIERDVTHILDWNKDGKLDSKDAKGFFKSAINNLTSNMGSSSAGFAGGFLLGAR